MRENTIIQTNQLISNDINLSKSQKEILTEIELSIYKINNLLKREKIRENLIKTEIKINKDYYKNNFKEYLILISKNIRKLTLFLEILENKKKVVLFDAKNYFKSMQDINIEEPISIV